MNLLSKILILLFITMLSSSCSKPIHDNLGGVYYGNGNINIIVNNNNGIYKYNNVDNVYITDSSIRFNYHGKRLIVLSGIVEVIRDSE